MQADELVQYYRLLDVSYGNLEISQRIRNELIALRREQIQSRKKSLLDRSLLILLTVVAGIPVLYSLLPEQYATARILWVTTFIAVAILYWCVGLLQWRTAREEDAELKRSLDVTPSHSLEDDPLFLQTQISTFLTRRSVAQEILEGISPEEIRGKFIRVESYWLVRLKKAKRRARELFEAGKISEARHRELMEWLKGVDEDV